MVTKLIEETLERKMQEQRKEYQRLEALNSDHPAVQAYLKDLIALYPDFLENNEAQEDEAQNVPNFLQLYPYLNQLPQQSRNNLPNPRSRSHRRSRTHSNRAALS